MTQEIRLPAPHPRFRPRVEAEMRRPGHPGTAVRIGEDLYEVVAAERSGAGWIYRLEPWTGRDTIRVYVDWNEEAERVFIAGLRDDRVRAQRSFLAWAAQAFLGFLPAAKQEKFQQTTGLDPARATLWSAVLETSVAAPVVTVFMINLITGAAGLSAGFIPAWVGLLAFAAAADGVFRLCAVISTREPIGSAFLAVFSLRLKSEAPRCAPGDEISEIGDALAVISPVPKVWWERAGGVTYGGESYILRGSSCENARFFYRFRKGGGGFPVLDPELEKVRNRSSDLSFVLAPLWGFLPAGLQKALEFYGRYRPRPYVILSIVFSFLAALAMVGPGLRNLSQGVFEIGNAILLAASITLFAESVLRSLRLIWEGKTTGSLLAFLVKPVYRFAIKDKPSTF